MTQDLITTFGKSDGRTYDWKYKGLDPDLSASEIKNACELLTKLDICTKNGVKLFDSVITAKVVTYKETLMFDPEHETKGVNYYGETVEKTVEEPTCEEVGCFEVVNEPESNQAKEKSGWMPSSIKRIVTSAPAFKPETHFERLTEPVENTKPSIKVQKDSLPQLKHTKPMKEIVNAPQKQPSECNHIPKPAAKTREDGKGLLHWIQKIRSRNKEDPTNT